MLSSNDKTIGWVDSLTVNGFDPLYINIGCFKLLIETS